jgi:predicted ATPase
MSKIALGVNNMLDEEIELHIKGLNIDWNKIAPYSYLREIPSIAGVEHLTFHKPITFFVGENGSGKSTMLEAIAVAYGFNPEGGTKNYSFSTYDSHSELCNAIRLVKGYKKAGWGYFLRAESFYNVATAEEEYSKERGGVPQFLHQKSHGESFLAMAQSNFRANGVYLLDEPEAALSPQRQLTLLLEIVACANEDSQFIIVTHSPILLGMPGAEILSFDDGEIHRCEYEETDSYQVTEMFINNREQILKRLLE